jgi:FkbM family methyltransferase
MSEWLRRGDLVFDVGANVGAKAELFAARGARVVCVEPQPRCVAALRRRFQAQPRVALVEAGLAAAPGRMALSVCREADTISTFSDAWKTGRFANFRWDERLEVAVTTLDALIAEHGVPRYVKIDVEGFELEVLRGLSRAVPLLSFEFAIEFADVTRACVERLRALGFTRFNAALGESAQLGEWTDADGLHARLGALSDPLAWGDVYATTLDEPPRALPADTLTALRNAGLAAPERPLRLHLGCGEQRLDGYVNLDYAPDAHNVMRVRADFHADVAALEFPSESVDEIRLHHVFEHFPRVVALALLVRWQRWLKPGGVLRIETPDLEGSARVIASTEAPLAHKLAAARHLAGDQAAPWAYHVDLWFPERFRRTLARLGFTDVAVTSSRWAEPPHLANVDVSARRGAARTLGEQLAAADELLWDATVARVERPTWEVWRAQLRAILDGAPALRPANVTASAPAPTPAPRASAPDVAAIVFSKDRPLQLEALLRSFTMHAADPERVALKVLWRATDERARAAYARVADEHPSVEFIAETRFRDDLIAAFAGAPYCLFLVDDTLFAADFRVGDAIALLDAHADLLGFSLRLGRNTTYVYPLDRAQPMPPLDAIAPRAIAWDWTRAELAFAYPLEVSSSLYRARELAPLLARLAFANPNTLEAELARAATPDAALPPRLASYERSVAFSAPLNLVQSVWPNRASARPDYSAPALLDAFAAGDRVDVAAYHGFQPNGCHAEIELAFVRAQEPPLALPTRGDAPTPPGAPAALRDVLLAELRRRAPALHRLWLRLSATAR